MDILTNMNNPRLLEQLYRENKASFKKEFNSLYPGLMDNKLADYWNARLNYENAEITWGSNKELGLVIIISLLAGIFAKFPALLNIDREFFYTRNIGFIVFPFLTTYFIWKKGLPINKIAIVGILFLMAFSFINLLPRGNNSDTLILSCMHLPIFLWAILGFSYTGNKIGDKQQKLNFLRYNGDLIIMTGLIIIAGAILTGITITLFEVIGLHIENFYANYIGVFGLSAAPIVGTYITQTNPQLVSKVSPVIAKIFSPLVLITLVIYLGAIFFSGKNPYTDRDFLTIFNCLLIGVMAIILFSVAETAKQNNSSTSRFILLALSIITVLVNGIALSAILFRISEWGITPNRLAILGANVLMLTNLLIITFKLYKSVSKKADIIEVENAIASFLPIYIAWTVIVIFIFPLVFNFK